MKILWQETRDTLLLRTVQIDVMDMNWEKREMLQKMNLKWPRGGPVWSEERTKTRYDQIGTSCQRNLPRNLPRKVKSGHIGGTTWSENQRVRRNIWNNDRCCEKWNKSEQICYEKRRIRRSDKPDMLSRAKNIDIASTTQATMATRGPDLDCRK